VGDAIEKEKFFDFLQSLDLENCEFIVKLADFGMAKELLPDQMTNTCAGTPLSMDPSCLMEQAYNSKADLFSFGVLLFQLITGQYPFIANTPQQLQKVHQQGTYQIPQDVRISVKCVDLIHNLLLRKAEERISFEDFDKHPWLQDEMLMSLNLEPAPSEMRNLDMRMKMDFINKDQKEVTLNDFMMGT